MIETSQCARIMVVMFHLLARKKEISKVNTLHRLLSSCFEYCVFTFVII